VAMFVTGCAGQINTGHSAEASLSIRSSEARSFKEMTRLGRAVAGAAVQASEHAAGSRGAPCGRAPSLGDETQVRAVTVQVSVPREPVADADEFRARAREWRHDADSLAPGSEDFDTERDRLLRWAAWAERMAAEAPHDSAVSLDVTAMRWGDIYLVGLPGEPFVEFGFEIRQRTSADVVVVGYANGCPGYVPHRSAYPEGGYEVLHAHKGYGAPSAFAPEAGERLVDAAVEALGQLGLSHVGTDSQTIGHARLGASKS
jgi:neutral ceramidase